MFSLTIYTTNNQFKENSNAILVGYICFNSLLLLLSKNDRNGILEGQTRICLITMTGFICGSNTSVCLPVMSRQVPGISEIKGITATLICNVHWLRNNHLYTPRVLNRLAQQRQQRQQRQQCCVNTKHSSSPIYGQAV